MGLLDDLQTKFPNMSRDQILGLMDPGQANIVQGKDLNGQPMPGISAPENQIPLQFDAFGKSNMTPVEPTIEHAPKQEVAKSEPVRAPAARASEPEHDESEDINETEDQPSEPQPEEPKKEQFKFPTNDTPDTTKAFNDALTRRKDAEETAVLSKIGAQLGGAIAKASPDVVNANMQLADAIGGLGGHDLRDLNDKIAFQANDPNSNYSQKAKQFLISNFGVKPESLEGLSVTQLDKSFPALKAFESAQTIQAKRDIASQKSDDYRLKLQELAQKTEEMRNNKSSQNAQKASDKQNQAFNATSSLLESARGQPAVAQAEKDLYAVDKINTMINLKNNPDELNPQQVQLLASEIGKVATGGVPTVHELQGLQQSTIPSKLAQLAQAALNEPQGAEAGKFIKAMKEYTDSVGSDAKKLIKDRYGRIITSRGSQFTDEQRKLLEDQYVHRFDNSGNSHEGSSGTVKVIDPNGIPRMIPKDQLQDALSHGGKLAQ